MRTAQANDADEIARIYVDSWNVGFDALVPHRELTDELVARWREDLSRPAPHRWWVAEADGEIWGFVGVGPSRDPIDPAVGELDTIAVDPRHWRKGVGRQLMATALATLRADGYEQAVLWTLTDYERGQRFYEETGWAADGAVRSEGRQMSYRHPLARQ